MCRGEGWGEGEEDEVEAIFGNLRNVFVRPDATKVEVIEVLNEHLQDFQHIEKGIGLDLMKW